LDAIAMAVTKFHESATRLPNAEVERIIRDRLTLKGSGFATWDLRRIAEFWRFVEPVIKRSRIPTRKEDAIYGLIIYAADVLFGHGAVGYEDRDYVITRKPDGYWLDFISRENPNEVEKRVIIGASIDGIETAHNPDLNTYRSQIVEESVAGWPECRRLPFARLVNDLVWEGAPWVKGADLAPGGKIYDLIVGKAKSEFKKRKRSRIETFQNECGMNPSAFLALDDEGRINFLEKRSRTPEEKDKAAVRALNLNEEAKEIETMSVSKGDLKTALRERIIERLGRKWK